MEAAVFIGIQGAGKTTFYLAHFFRSHVRIGLDMLRTRHREAILVRACIEAKQRFVVDNTNPSVAERARYLTPARAAGFRTVAYYFPPDVEACLERNAGRPERERVPAKGLLGTRRRLEVPTLSEGFDRLCAVTRDGRGGFVVEEWRHDG